MTPSEIRYDEFDAADYDEAVAIYRATLDDPDLMHGEMAFTMLSRLFHDAARHDDRARYDELSSELRERLPEVYQEKARSLLKWRSLNLLAMGDIERLRPVAMELSQMAGEAIDGFFAVAEALSYRGHLALLLEMTQAAFPHFSDADSLTDWLPEEGDDDGLATLLIFDYLEHHRWPAGGDPELLRRVECLHATDPERFHRYLSYLTGQAGRTWSMADLDFPAVPQPLRRGLERLPEDEQERRRRANLFDFSAEFLGYLRRDEGIPYPKGELARGHLAEYILERAAGDLGPRLSMMEWAMLGGREPRVPPTPAPEHVLCPDAATMDRFLGGLSGLFEARHYRIATTFELVPAWLRFCESRGLIDAGQRERSLADLASLLPSLHKVMSGHPEDPALADAIERWPG